MKRHSTYLLLLMVCSTFLSISQSSAAACIDKNFTEFKSEVTKLKSKKIVFFASWCPSCKNHLLAAKDDPLAVLVATLDSREKAEQALNFLHLEHLPCFFDKDESIIKGYQIEGLPGEVVLKK